MEEAQPATMRFLLMTHPGIGPSARWRFVLASSGNSFVAAEDHQLPGAESHEESSGGRGGSGCISSRATPCALAADRNGASCRGGRIPNLRRTYQRLKFRRGHAVAKGSYRAQVGCAYYWMLRSGAQITHGWFAGKAAGGHPGGRESIA